MGTLALDYWLTRSNWSLYVSFLIFTGIALVIAMPSGGAAPADPVPNLKMFFPIAYIVLYGIIAMNLGQDVGANGRSPLLLSAQLAFALFITIPYWIVFKTIIHTGWLQILWGLGHLFVYGFMLGLFGVLLVTLFESEITQFNVKYAFCISYLLGSLFIAIAHPVSPFHALAFILGDKALHQPTLFFLESYGAFAIITAFLLFLIRWKMRK